MLLQLDELASLNKALSAKDKELARLTERLLVKQDECDKLENEVKRLRNAESWKTTSPNSSTSDLSTSVRSISLLHFWIANTTFPNSML